MEVGSEVSRACVVLGQASHGHKMTIILIVREATWRFDRLSIWRTLSWRL